MLSTIGTSAFIVQLFVASTPRPTASESMRAHCFAILVATHNLPVGSSGATHQHDEVDGENTCIDHLTVRCDAEDGRQRCYRTRVLRGWGWGTAVLHAPFCVQSILRMGGNNFAATKDARAEKRNSIIVVLDVRALGSPSYYEIHQRPLMLFGRMMPRTALLLSAVVGTHGRAQTLPHTKPLG